MFKPAIAPRAKIVTITSRKGGVGKTATTSLLARYFAEVEGKNVLVVDFDARGGITSLLCDRAITQEDLSIGELLLTADEQGNIHDVFAQAVIDTGLEKNKHWEDSGGKLYLLPAKKTLDTVLEGKHSSLLRIMLLGLGLPDEHIILVDTSPDGDNVLMGIGAADVVFLPLKYSQQDVHPTVETLRTIIMEQQGNGNAVLGGLVVNQVGDTQWEQAYEQRYSNLFMRFKEKTGLRSATDHLFIHLKHSRIIQRGTYMDWKLREYLLDPAEKMAAALHAVKLRQRVY
jgi:cellulose biosynthesis protein BcsQ